MTIADQMKVATDDALLYFKQKLGQVFQSRELKTGSAGDYKTLTDNNLTDELVSKINNADSKAFSGSYADLAAKPSINGSILEGSQSLADLGIASASSVPVKVSQLTNDAGYASAVNTAEDIAAGDAAQLAAAKAYADAKAGAIVVPSKTSQLTNDSSYPTSAQVQTSVEASASAVKSELRAAIDAAVSSTYKPAGSVAYASLPTPSETLLGNVYNVTDAFVTGASFVEGSGVAYPRGSNVVCVNVSEATYKWDVLAGMVDLSGYVKTDDIQIMTNADVDAMF